jgi:TM2 domain-containing membrane protein YozV
MNLNSRIFKLLPEASAAEVAYISNISANWTDEETQKFLHFYNGERTKPDTLLLLTLLGIIGVAGINRFVTGQIGMGILYLLTAGLCLIGTIIDAVNYKKLADEHNVQIAQKLMYRLGFKVS